ncbi:MAG: chromosomal replication initiation protein [Actinobacteria bacterium BACL2 MAG-121001-bin67]|jgi:chromosomal replication initiator protein|uniref:Chromosomal replication initiator protein DnaA n=4 Tax=ac1 cluster TaxID=1655545 RepID=A0A0R2P9K1_9ACTN|nr:MAG: chromosomal replication initiation protein [Actinobacteria bacterium BACL2 MAG-120802-bin41]KRO32675.1 MAG: chromosomal replication initiation protein [Actinobacteria bacterium BACL2 MAG-121001-bin67]KRO33444.1 MAG: chromosomal replication initiation protein [Actinobacteria bacterium BACL2 MAG-121220-bin52]KRO45076.1 MAG: chromosomal replication initiation protein [Actinobacteria bacterium BACL2 MAG-120813-bin23]KRO73733.1 MAG: chromosomal replication initiation protein [Actinobacteria 
MSIAEPGALEAKEIEADLLELWKGIVDSVAKESPQNRAFLTLTKPLGLLKSDGGSNLLLAAPNVFAKDVLESRLKVLLNDALSAKLGERINIAVTVDESLDADLSVVEEVDVEVESPRAGTGRQEVQSKSSDQTQLNPRYIFETFVIGASNRFAHAAAVAVAEAPAKAYNPLFIYGESGLGKTHLLQAIGAYAKELYGGVRVRYVSSEEFTNDFINSIRDDKSSNFQRRYRDLDVLLVDDIQFLENKERTQEEFFHTFNTLYNANKQIVISSDRPPKQLTTLEDRLRSRFEWGLITDIQPPELETRIAILRKKAAQDKLNAPDDVLEYIASKISTNIRELEGALIRVTAFASLNRQIVDMNLAEIVLKDLIPDDSTPEITASLIMAQTASYFSLTLDDLCGTSRSRVLVNARQIAMYLCREMTELSLPKIGQTFGGRDHTTVMHADRKVRHLMAERRSIFNQVSELTNRIKLQAKA